MWQMMPHAEANISWWSSGGTLALAASALTLAKERVDLEELQRENSLQMRHLESGQRQMIAAQVTGTPAQQ
jgi:hypothetical protein